MSGTVELWILIAALGIGTFMLRYAFFFIFGRYEVPEFVKEVLPFIPAAALSALVMPKVFASPVSAATLHDPRVWAWSIAMVIAWKTRNVLYTIISGMAVLWGIQALL